MTLGPLTIFALMFAYIWFVNPADQAGWGALVFVVMMLTAVSFPIGLLVLLLGYAFTGPKREGGFGKPNS